MTTPPHGPEGTPTVITTLTPFIDFLSKGIAAFAIALYGSGFLIVSLHHSSYGFIGTNPFRPRVVAAGAWFFFLTAIPLFTIRKWIGPRQTPWTELFAFSYPYCFGCLFLSLFASPFFIFPAYPASTPQLFSWDFPAPNGIVKWWWLFATMLLIAPTDHSSGHEEGLP